MPSIKVRVDQTTQPLIILYTLFSFYCDIRYRMILPCDYNLNLYSKAYLYLYNISLQIGMSTVCLIKKLTIIIQNLSVSSCCLCFAGKITAGRMLNLEKYKDVRRITGLAIQETCS